MTAYLFRMDCITNMHVGNGDVNYNIIDNEVEKDPVLCDVPVIHASGVKGALKEHCEAAWGKTDKRIINIFGDKDNAGQYIFFGAGLIARPLRVSNGNRPYILTTSVDILKSFTRLLEGVGIQKYSLSGIKEFNDDKFHVSINAVKEVEGKEAVPLPPEFPSLEAFLGGEYAVLDSMRNYDLPVLARNVLDDKGLSQNLWYEEIVPHKSRFCFIILTPDKDLCFDTFKLEIINNGPVQFGGNESIGYGFTAITEV